MDTTIHVSLIPQGSARTADWTAGASRGTGDCLLLHTREPSPELLPALLEAMSRDPRVASVSAVPMSDVAPLLAADADQPPPVDVPASAPAGTMTVLSPTGLELVGAPDACTTGLPITPDDVTNWARRATDRGLGHRWLLVAGDATRGSGLPAADADANEASATSSPLSTAVDRIRSRADSLRVVVDASWLGQHETGAQVATVNTVAALATRADVHEVVLWNMPGGLPPYAAVLAGNPRVRVQSSRHRTEPRADVVWRPYQPDSHVDLDRYRDVARRTVVTYLDLIAFANPRYHATEDSWLGYRALQRDVAMAADMVTTISGDVAKEVHDAVPGVPRERLRAVPLGVDHLESLHAPLSAPVEITRVWPEARTRPFLLVLGNDFAHKNRDLAIRAWCRLVDSGVDVDLVLAGLHVGTASSREEELHALRGRGAAPRVVGFEHTSTRAKNWLLAHATVVLYPSSAEGFGLVPYEAAVLGTPTVFTRFGPLAEFLGSVPAVPDWSVDGYADLTRTVLTDAVAREAQVAGVLDVSRRLTWSANAAGMVDAFRAALSLPPNAAGASGGAGESARVHELLTSTSWRVTAPLRSASRAASRLRSRGTRS